MGVKEFEKQNEMKTNVKKMRNIGRYEMIINGRIYSWRDTLFESPELEADLRTGFGRGE